MKSTILLILLTLFLSSCTGPKPPLGNPDNPGNPDNSGNLGNSGKSPGTPNASDVDVKDLYIAIDGFCYYKPSKDSEGTGAIAFNYVDGYAALGTSAEDALNRYNSNCQVHAFGASGNYAIYSYTDYVKTYSCAEDGEVEVRMLREGERLLDYCKQIYNKCGMGFCKHSLL